MNIITTGIKNSKYFIIKMFIEHSQVHTGYFKVSYLTSYLILNMFYWSLMYQYPFNSL